MVLAFENTLASPTNNPHSAIHALDPKESSDKKSNRHQSWPRSLLAWVTKKGFVKEVAAEQNFEVRIFDGLMRTEHCPAARTA